MGLFDDFVDIAREFNTIKEDIVGTFTDATSDVRSTVDDVKQQLTDATGGVQQMLDGSDADATNDNQTN